MRKRKSYEVREQILFLVREKPLSYTQIQTKLSTNYDSVKNNCSELELYNLIHISRIDRHPENGRPSFYVELTKYGYKVVKRLSEKKDKHNILIH